MDSMKTKEEYQESLNRMEESYYSSDNSMGAMSRFKEDINLITQLVNEYFKEHPETNFEHYKDGIIELCIDELAISKGKVVECCAIPCSECGFADENGDCIGRHRIKEWLKKPYQKQTFKLTKFEFDLIQTYRDCHESCKLSEFKQLIELKDKGYFKCVDHDTKIHDVLKNCEVIK